MFGRTRSAIALLMSAALAFTLMAVSPEGVGAAAPLSIGDVLVASGGGTIQQHSSAGAFIQALDTTTGVSENDGMCFDPQGNLYATNGFSDNVVSKFDPAGNLVAAAFLTVPSGNDPESCVVDASGNVFVGSPDGDQDVIRFDSSGAQTGAFDVQTQNRGSDWLDLAADQCTLFYTSEGSTIFRYNVCTGSQLTPFATNVAGGNECFALRIRPNGEVMAACDDQIVRFDSSGAEIGSLSATTLGFPSSAFLFAMNLDSDGTSFWTADYGNGQVVHASIADGSVIGGFTASGNGPFGGLSVVGELTAAQPPTTTTTEPPPSSTTTAAPSAAQTTPRFTG